MLFSPDMRPVLVVGPHRSGTSVTTRVISLLGPALCAEEDRMIKPDNPAGHWESMSLMTLNEELLAALGGTWYAPPELPIGWERSDDLAELRQRAVEQFYRVHPASGWVWKDPRLCLLLPFWTTALEIDPVVVLTVRHPVEIARSMMARDRFEWTHVLAIWEHHVVSALRNMAGFAVGVVRYDDLLANPRRETARLQSVLGGFGVDVSGAEVDAAADTVDERYRHNGASGSEGLSPEQAKVFELELNLDPAHPAFALAQEPWLSKASDELLRAQRKIYRSEREIEGRTAWALKLRDEIEERDSTIRSLQGEVEERTGWALKLNDEIRDRDATIRQLQAEIEERTRWALQLDEELHRCRDLIRDRTAAGAAG